MKAPLIFCFCTTFLLIGCRTMGSFSPALSNIPSSGGSSYQSSPFSSNSPKEEKFKTNDKNVDFYGAKINQGPPKKKKDIKSHYHIPYLPEHLDYHPDKLAIREIMPKVEIKDDVPKECNHSSHQKFYFQNSEVKDEKYIQYLGAKYFSNTARILNKYKKDDLTFYSIVLYDCPKGYKREKTTIKSVKNSNTAELDVLLGSYIERNGFLKLLGETGPTIGFSFNRFSKNNVNYFGEVDLGWHLHFNFDHFVDTDSSFLHPKFSEEDFTNYLWSVGPSLRYIANHHVQLNYNLGLGINFLEIDTNRTNENLSNAEATRTTTSLVHQLGIYFRTNDFFEEYNYKREHSLVGINLLYYWMPDALGEFADNNSELESYSGGSYAIFFSIKTQSILFK